MATAVERNILWVLSVSTLCSDPCKAPATSHSTDLHLFWKSWLVSLPGIPGFWLMGDCVVHLVSANWRTGPKDAGGGTEFVKLQPDPE